jgi:hypothetical protein
MRPKAVSPFSFCFLGGATPLLLRLNFHLQKNFLSRRHGSPDDLWWDLQSFSQARESGPAFPALDIAIAQGIDPTSGLERVLVFEPKAKRLAIQTKLRHLRVDEIG